VGDLFLARADGSPQRFYSLSAQIQRERKAYYGFSILLKYRLAGRVAATAVGAALITIGFLPQVALQEKADRLPCHPLRGTDCLSLFPIRSTP
jgi:Fic family protein